MMRRVCACETQPSFFPHLTVSKGLGLCAPRLRRLGTNSPGLQGCLGLGAWGLGTWALEPKFGQLATSSSGLLGYLGSGALGLGAWA